MIDFVVRSCGPFFIPQLALSLMTIAIVIGYVFGWLRGELNKSDPSWEKTLDPLAGVAVGVGLLGSVVSFCVAFSGVKETGFEVARISAGLMTAYVTTAVGLVTSLIASLASWALGALVK